MAKWVVQQYLTTVHDPIMYYFYEKSGFWILFAALAVYFVTMNK